MWDKKWWFGFHNRSGTIKNNQKLWQHLYSSISLNQWLRGAYSSDIFGGRGGDENCVEFAWVAVEKWKGSSHLHMTMSIVRDFQAG